MYLCKREKPDIYRNMYIGNNVGGEITTVIFLTGQSLGWVYTQERFYD